MVFDVRCLPNPHWTPHLRNATGKDEPVIKFLTDHQEVQDMYDDIQHYLDRWLPRFESSNRSYVTVAVGCTGGQHRSVYIAEKLHKHFETRWDSALVYHRELRPDA